MKRVTTTVIWTRWILLVLMGTGIAICVNGQQSSFRNFTIRDGLASNTVYHLIRDSEGFLWAATDAGVSRYDGTRFETFTMADGLGDNEILKIVEDPYGRIWFLPYNGRLSYFRKGKFYNDGNDSRLKAIDNYSPYFNYFIANDSALWLSTLHNGVLKIDPISLTHFNLKTGFPLKRASVFIQGGQDTIILPQADPTKSFSIGNIETRQLPIFYNKEKPLPTQQTKFSNSVNGRYVAMIEDNLWIANSAQPIIHHSLGFTDNPNSISWNGSDSVWLHTELNGSILLKVENGELIQAGNFLPGVSTTSSVFFQGQLWISSYRNGLFKLNGFTRLQFFPASQIGSIDNIQFSQNHKELLGISSRGFFNLDGENWTFFKENFSEGPNPKYKAIKEFNGAIYLSTHFSVFKLEEGRLSRIFENKKIYFDPSVVKDFIIFDSSIYVSANNGIFKMDKDQISKIQTGKEFEEMGLRSTKILLVDDTLWIGTTRGLKVGILSSNSISNWLPTNLAANISFFAPHPDGSIWVGTSGMGIHVFRNGKLEYSFKDSSGLQSNFINEIWHENDSSTWAVSNTGIIHFTQSPHLPPITYNFSYFTADDGLQTERMRCIRKKGDKIWIGGDEGLGEYEVSNYAGNNQKITTAFTRILVGKTNLPIDSIPELAFNQNDITIHFSSLTPQFTSNIQWEYKINQADWRKTDQNQLKLAGLPPGKYTIQVKSSFLGSSIESEPATLSFTILAPFTQTWPFYLLIGLLGVGVVGAIFYLISRARLNRANLNRKITESRLTALRTQMNPHFIFNSLNSIQNFITNNEKDAAFLYLARFGKLMRRVLDNSDHNLIPLEDEIATLELYCQLEQLRSNNGFDFSFEVQDDIDQEFTLIPPTLIQPIIENAIWHGVMQAEHRGLITVRFALASGWLTCTITDNGIGRDKAREIAANRRRHKSRAIGITQERLTLLNNTVQTQISMEVIDLKDEHGKAIGTEVVLKIPDIEE